MSIETLATSKILMNEQQVGHTVQYDGLTGLMDASGKQISLVAEENKSVVLPQEKGALVAAWHGYTAMAQAGFDAAELIKGQY